MSTQYPSTEELERYATEVDPGNIKGTHIGIDPSAYDTPVPRDRQAEFQQWKAVHAPGDSGIDYDWGGAFLEGFTPGNDGHWPDKYKKPNHPTFSVESKYATGVMEALAGRWIGDRQYMPSYLVHLAHNRVEGWKHNGTGLVRLVSEGGSDRPFAAPPGGVTGEWNAKEVLKHRARNLQWAKRYLPGADAEWFGDGLRELFAVRNFLNRYETGERKAPRLSAALKRVAAQNEHKSNTARADILRAVAENILVDVPPDKFRRAYRDTAVYLKPLLANEGMSEDLASYATGALADRIRAAARTMADEDMQDLRVRIRRVKGSHVEQMVRKGRHAFGKPGDTLGQFLHRHRLTETRLRELNADHPDFGDGIPAVPLSDSGKYPWRILPDDASVHQDAKGGDAPGASDEAPPRTGAPVPQGGPRIVVNPSTFRNEKDALCVAMNEAFRVVMEDMEFEPVSEPTERQRRFFSDTAYADDELQMRRTILARICTFDTSVQDPTDEQIQEAVEFLTSVMEAGYPENEWEQSAVMRIRDALAEAEGAPAAEPGP